MLPGFELWDCCKLWLKLFPLIRVFIQVWEMESLLSCKIWVCRGVYRAVPYEVNQLHVWNLFYSPSHLVPTVGIVVSLEFYPICTGKYNVDDAWDFNSHLKGVMVGASSSLQGINVSQQRWESRCTAEGGKMSSRTRKHSGDMRNSLFLLYGRSRTWWGFGPAAAGVETWSRFVLAGIRDAFAPQVDGLRCLNWDGCVIGGEAGRVDFHTRPALVATRWGRRMPILTFRV